MVLADAPSSGEQPSPHPLAAHTFFQIHSGLALGAEPWKASAAWKQQRVFLPCAVLSGPSLKKIRGWGPTPGPGKGHKLPRMVDTGCVSQCGSCTLELGPQPSDPDCLMLSGI